MAATVTKNDAQKVGGKWLFSWDIVETSIGVEETAITDVPVRGTIVKLQSVHVSGGSSRTVAPVLGRSTFTPGDINQVNVRPTAAALVIDTTRTPYYSPTGTLYLESTPSAGSDNTVHTKLLIVASWE